MGTEDHVKPRWKTSVEGKRTTIAAILAFSFALIIGWSVVRETAYTFPTSIVLRSQPRKGSTSDSQCKWMFEPLQGSCDVTKPTEQSRAHLTAEDCEKACCGTETCISFQFRAKEGCLWGGDTRLGGEKDGPSAWCEPRPPAIWHGQWIKTKGSGEAVPGACTREKWNPNELNGQCFGLGSKQVTSLNTPESCRDACCTNTDCFIWQWRSDAGCFFNDDAFNCQEANPQDFEPFFGKRKFQEGRSYTPEAYSGDFSDMAKVRER